MSSAPSQQRSVQQLFDLSGKVALISGASGNLGSVMSRALAEAGASVVVTSRDESRAKQIAAELPASGGAEHHGIAMDHMQEGSLNEAFAKAVQQAGKLDILVNNGHDALGKDWTNVEGTEFSHQLANATGYFLLARLMREHVVKRSGSGSIIMLGSMYGMVASYPDAYQDVCVASPVAYQCLKGGIIQMTRHLGAYWAKEGIRVNCLSPGAFPNPEKVPRVLVERLIAKCPMGRMGVNHELKGAIVFLASDASSYMTGQNLVIDGGWTAW